MKLTKEKLKQIIKEELEAAQNESLGMGATPYELGYDAGYVRMPATVEMMDNEEYMKGYNDGLAAGGHPPLSEGYKGMRYKKNPSLRPDYKGTGGPNPDYPPKGTEVDQVEQMKSIAAMIRRQTGKDVRITIDGEDIEK
jgi:hypothetical protein